MSQQPDRSVVYTKPVRMMKKTHMRKMFSYDAELNKAATMPKAKSVFLIFSANHVEPVK